MTIEKHVLDIIQSSGIKFTQIGASKALIDEVCWFNKFLLDILGSQDKFVWHSIVPGDEDTSYLTVVIHIDPYVYKNLNLQGVSDLCSRNHLEFSFDSGLGKLVISGEFSFRDAYHN